MLRDALVFLLIALVGLLLFILLLVPNLIYRLAQGEWPEIYLD